MEMGTPIPPTLMEVETVSEEFLSQEEIDSLLKSQVTPEPEHPLSLEEIDVIGEVGNISMGSAATIMSDLVRNKVRITTPQIKFSSLKELFSSFVKPYVVIDITYTEGLTGSNLLLISQGDAVIIADLMMGGTGEVENKELSEMELSAVSEAMNQMMGSAATAMSNMFGFSVIISPPNAKAVEFDKEEYEIDLSDDKVAAVSFRLEVGDLIDSQIMQVMPLNAAREMVRHLLKPSLSESVAAAEVQEEKEVVVEPQTQVVPPIPEELSLPPQPEQYLSSLPEADAAQSDKGGRNLDLILDVPLKVSVVLGRCRKPIGEVLKLVPGTIVELDSLADEPVDILVNGTLIAQGEVVVVNENFGIQVKNIVSPHERLQRLRY